MLLIGFKIFKQIILTVNEILKQFQADNQITDGKLIKVYSQIPILVMNYNFRKTNTNMTEYVFMLLEI